MKKLLILVLCALMLLLPACAGKPAGGNDGILVPPTPPGEASGDAAGTLKIADYFPFTPDVHMRYLGKGNEYAEFETYVDYIRDNVMQVRTINPGTVSVSVYALENGALKKVFSEGEVYYRLDFTASRDGEEIMLEDPLKVGTAWKLKDGSTRTITSAAAKVTVPYGTFDALEVTTDGEFSTLKSYYAKGIGLIKTEYAPKEDPSSTVTSELEAIGRNENFVQKVRFYYPDFEKNRILYQQKDISLSTGENIMSVFGEELRKVPEESGLTPVLSGKAEILGTVYNRETEIVTIDLSSEFIPGMNAGSGLEGLILLSLADTFGNYFQTEKIGFTVAGKPYESGHFKFGADEFMTATPENALEYLSK